MKSNMTKSELEKFTATAKRLLDDLGEVPSNAQHHLRQLTLSTTSSAKSAERRSSWLSAADDIAEEFQKCVLPELPKKPSGSSKFANFSDLNASCVQQSNCKVPFGQKSKSHLNFAPETWENDPPPEWFVVLDKCAKIIFHLHKDARFPDGMIRSQDELPPFEKDVQSTLYAFLGAVARFFMFQMRQVNGGPVIFLQHSELFGNCKGYSDLHLLSEDEKQLLAQFEIKVLLNRSSHLSGSVSLTISALALTGTLILDSHRIFVCHVELLT